MVGLSRGGCTHRVPGVTDEQPQVRRGRTDHWDRRTARCRRASHAFRRHRWQLHVRRTNQQATAPDFGLKDETELVVSIPVVNGPDDGLKFARQAIKILGDATNVIDTWVTHFDLGRAYLVERAYLQADSEFDRCIKRRGEALSLLVDEEPTFGYFPTVYYYQGLVREGLKSAKAADSYREYLKLRGASTEIGNKCLEKKGRLPFCEGKPALFNLVRPDGSDRRSEVQLQRQLELTRRIQHGLRRSSGTRDAQVRVPWINREAAP